jgi:opacity protein-like surface antigen
MAAVMTKGLKRPLVLLGLAIFAGVSAGAQTVEPSQVSPSPGRFEASILAGYRLEGSITSKSEQTPAVSLANAATYGLALDWRLNPYGDAELQYSYTSSPAATTNPSNGQVTRGYDMGIHDVILAVVANTAPIGKPIRPYISIGVGFTVLVPSNEFAAKTKFTVAFAAGVRAYFSEHYGVRLEARYTPVYLFSTGPCAWEWFLCTGGGTGHVIQQSDFRLGVIFRF